MSGRWVRCALLVLVASCGLARAQSVCHPLFEGDPQFGGTPPDSCDPTDGQIVVGFNWGFDPLTGMFLGFQWEQEQGMASFNVYGGRLRTLSDANHDGALDSYGTCVIENTPETVLKETPLPPVGDAYIYIVSGNGVTGESGFGAASNGTPRPNSFPCATTIGKPTIQDVQLVGGDQESQVSCDWTQITKGFICSAAGIAADQFAHFPAITLTVGYASGRLEALVFDPDSTPAESGIASVTAQYVVSTGGSPMVHSDLLLDDGSSFATPVMQYCFDILEDCPSDSFCPSCSTASYPLRGGDQYSRDDRFSKTYSFVSNQVAFDFPPQVRVASRGTMAWDCIMQATSIFPLAINQQIGEPISFDIEAVDRSGFVTWSPEHLSMPFRQTHFRCDGDDCACCLLFSASPSADCVDRPGLIGVPGSGFENGLCVAFF